MQILYLPSGIGRKIWGGLACSSVYETPTQAQLTCVLKNTEHAMPVPT